MHQRPMAARGRQRCARASGKIQTVTPPERKSARGQLTNAMAEHVKAARQLLAAWGFEQDTSMACGKNQHKMCFVIRPF